MNHLFASIRYLNVICVSFPFNIRYSSVLTVTCPEVDRSTTQVEHAKTCQLIRPDKTDITWHGTHSWGTNKNCMWPDTNGQRILLSVKCPLALSLYYGERSGIVLDSRQNWYSVIFTWYTAIWCKYTLNLTRFISYNYIISFCGFIAKRVMK